MKWKADNMEYLGVLSVLCEASPHVPEEIRESIEWALNGAECRVPGLRWKRVLNSYEIEFVETKTDNNEQDTQK